MRAVTLVVTSPAFDEDLGFVPRIEEFPVQPFISYVCSVTPSWRQASAIPRPFPISISTRAQLSDDLCCRLSCPCHTPSFRQPEILTPDLTWFKGGRSGAA